MSLDYLKSALSTIQTNQDSIDSWLADEQIKGEKRALFRQYVDGDHRANLTPEMRNMLRITSVGSLNEFNDNYMDVVVQTMKNRITLNTIDTETDDGNEWVQELLDLNRFDGLQGSVTESTIRDGDTFLFPTFDAKEQRVKLVHELAYDGVQGVLVKYERDDISKMQFAVKIWYETSEALADTTRVTVITPTEIRRYIGENGGQLRPYTADGVKPVQTMQAYDFGVPVVHFRNRMKRHSNQGQSEIENAIPLQDALNRTLVSTVMTSELTAFQIKVAKGFQPPAGVTPGMWVVISGESPLSPEEQTDAYVLEQGSIGEQLNLMQFLRTEIANTTQTPAPELLGSDNSSGEALKQRETPFLGKCDAFKVQNGNAWEDLILMAREIQARYGTNKPPMFDTANAKWEESQVRNDKEIIEMAMQIADKIPQRTFYEIIAPVFRWDNNKIDEIMDMMESESDNNFQRIANQIPSFNDADFTSVETDTEITPATNGNNNGQPELAGII